jgi:hypothetical protein
MMNWILLVMAAIVSVVVALILGGLATSRTRSAAREVRLRAPLDNVWLLVRMVSETPAWCPDLPSMTVLEETRPRLLKTQLLDDTGTPVGHWLVAMSERDGGTQLTVAEMVDVPNPIVRFFRSFGDDARRVDGFLRALGQQLGEPDVVVGPVTLHPSAEHIAARRTAARQADHPTTSADE